MTKRVKVIFETEVMTRLHYDGAVASKLTLPGYFDVVFR